MGFLGAFFLWGLPLAGLPVVVHLLARRRKQTVAWGAMQFLVAARQRVRRSWRLRDLLLLLLRVLALAALVLALARPLVPMHWLGGHSPRDVIVVFDQSMSTGAVDGAANLHERQVETVRTLFAHLDLDETDSLRILTVAGEARWLTEAAVPADSSHREQALSELGSLKPTLGSADPAAAIERALAAAPSRQGLPRSVHLVTDGQAHGWNPDRPGQWQSIRAQRAELPDGSEIRVWQARGESAPSPRPNLAVTRLEFSREMAAILEPVEIRATVTNFGVDAGATAVLHWLVDDDEVGLVSVPAIEPGADVTVTLEHSFQEAGARRVTGRLEGGDALELDDEAAAILEVAAGLPVLVVEGNPSTDPLETDSAYFFAALGGFTEEDQLVESAFRPAAATPVDLNEIDFGDYRVVVLSNTPQLSEEVTARLERFVRDGGGLWMALGPETDTAWFNERLAAQATGLSPARIGQAVGTAADRESFQLVAPPTQPHPATLLLGDTEKLDIDRARVFRRFPFTGDLQRELSVLLQLGDGSPLALERRLGEGRVIVQAVPLGASWSNFPLLLSYVAMVHEWLWYLLEPGMIRRNLDPGEPIETTVSFPSSAGTLALSRPDGSEEALGPLGVNEEKRVRYARTLDPGAYFLNLRSGDRLAASSPFSVRRDPRESDLQPLDEPARAALRSEGGLLFGDERPAEKAGGESKAAPTRKPVWEWLLAGVVALLLAESLLALSVSRRRRFSAAGASMEGSFPPSPGS